MDDVERLLDELDSVCEEVVGRHAPDVDRDARNPTESWAALGRIGVLALRVPARHGGLDVDLLTYVRVLERIAASCAASAMTVHMHATVCELIGAAATEERQREWFPITVDELGLFGSWGSEPTSSTSRGFHSETTVRPTDDGYVVDGSKYFCTMAGVARRAMVYCAVVDEAGVPEPGPQQIRSAFVDALGPGVEVTGAWDPVGMRGTVSPAVKFRDCPVAADALLPGLPDVGIVEQLALGFSAVILGSATAALDAAGEYLSKRTLVDAPDSLAHDPQVQRHFGRHVARLEAARCTLHHAARHWRDPDGPPRAVRGSTAKLVVSEAALGVTSELMQLVGGSSAMRSLPIERAFRDVRTATLMPPNPDRMAQVVGAASLGIGVDLYGR